MYQRDGDACFERGETEGARGGGERVGLIVDSDSDGYACASACLAQHFRRQCDRPALRRARHGDDETDGLIFTRARVGKRNIALAELRESAGEVAKIALDQRREAVLRPEDRAVAVEDGGAQRRCGKRRDERGA